MESHSLTLDEACAFLKISNNRHCPITGEDSGMKIEYQDYGAVANIVITSTVFEFRKHNRVVDAALLCTPGIVASRNGVFFMKSVLSGKSRDMLRANKTVQREANR